MKCRFCKTELETVFCDLGHQPPSNSYLKPAELKEAEVFYPLKVWACHECFLVQIDEFKSHKDIFSKDYAYFSSYIKSWVEHAKNYVEKTAIPKFELDKNSMFIEVAANDGWLLQHVKANDIPCLGIEPTASTAAAAREKGIEIKEIFFGEETAKQLVKEGIQADTTMAVNVLGHVPDLVDFLTGFQIILKPEGVAVFEIPHFLRLVQDNLFDTIYHEHFSYISLISIEKIAESCGLKVIEMESLNTHGGSMRIYLARTESKHVRNQNVDQFLQLELDAGMDKIEFYQNFQDNINKIHINFVSYLIEQKKLGKKIAAYGAAAKGNTLLNYCGVKSNLIDFICDISPHKQGMFLPGSHIPILHPDAIKEQKPDIIFIPAWNVFDEITKQLSFAKEWDTKFVVAMPELRES